MNTEEIEELMKLMDQQLDPGHRDETPPPFNMGTYEGKLLLTSIGLLASINDIPLGESYRRVSEASKVVGFGPLYPKMVQEMLRSIKHSRTLEQADIPDNPEQN